VTTGFRSFNICTGERVLNQLEPGNLRIAVRITAIKCAVNDGGGSGARCGRIKVRTDTTKLSNMVIASFGDG